MVAVAVAAPLVTAAGALAPTFPFLVATQALGRPLGLVLDFMVAVVAAEEMPRNSRAYAVSVLALASGLGAGVAILALPLADLVARRMALRLPRLADLAGRRRRPRPPAARERSASNARTSTAPPLDRRRFAVLATIALLSNLFIAPASLFQNGYLKDVRGFDGHDDRRVHARHRHPGRARPDPRRAPRRHVGPPPHHRRRPAGVDGVHRACPTPSAAR